MIEENLQTENEEAEKLKEDNNQDSKQEEKKSSKRAISIFIAADILIVIIIILLLCLKNCKPAPNQDNSGNLIDTERVNKITDIFRKIVKDNMAYNGYGDDNLDKIIAITYKDNYPTNFSLDITVTSATKVYYCSITDYEYDGDKEQYSDFLSYLLLDTTHYSVGQGIPYLNPNSKTDIKISSAKTINRYVISENNSEPKDKYFFGFYKEDNSFYVYQNRPYIDESDPFTSHSDQIIKSDSPLYDYYQALLTA